MALDPDAYRKGQRVKLVATDDPHTELRPGDQGTVRRWDARLGHLDVDWDSGSRLSLVLDGATADEVSIL